MVDTLVSLGGFVFSSWAVPEQVNGGGRQKLVVHKLIGGTRVIDVMGWDAARLCFSGRLRGAAAADSVRLLETLARSGTPVVFGYWTNRYQVVVESFSWCFERFYEIAYELSLTVLADLTQDAWRGSADTLDDVIGSDISLATTVALDLPTAAVALALVSAAQTAAGTLQRASQAALLPLTQTVDGALATTQSLGATLDAGFPLAAAGGVVAGGDPAVMAASATAQASGLQQLTAATEASAVLRRAQSNLATAPR